MITRDRTILTVIVLAVLLGGYFMLRWFSTPMEIIYDRDAPTMQQEFDPMKQRN
jgi:hypothetical protein